MPPYLQRSERKQRLVSEGTAITKSEVFPVPAQRVLELEIRSKVVGAKGCYAVFEKWYKWGCWISGNDRLHFDDEIGDEDRGKGDCCLFNHFRGAFLS